jgi:hypothetical protein
MTTPVRSDPRFEAAVAANTRNWQEFLKDDPALAALELGMARAVRIMVCEWNSSPIYAQAVTEYRRFLDARNKLLRKRHDR